jgi:hypothetical protein
VKVQSKRRGIVKKFSFVFVGLVGIVVLMMTFGGTVNAEESYAERTLFYLEGPGFIERVVTPDGRILIGFTGFLTNWCEKIPDAFSCLRAEIVQDGRYALYVEVFLPPREKTTKIVFVPYDGPIE